MANTAKSAVLTILKIAEEIEVTGKKIAEQSGNPTFDKNRELLTAIE